MYNKFLYANGITNIFLGNVDFVNDVIKMALLTDWSPGPNQDTNNLWADVSAHEASGTGYTAGGKTVTGISVDDYSYTDPGFSMLVVADSINWSGLTLDFRYAVLYDSTSGCLLAILDFTGTTISLSGQTFGIAFPNDVVMSIYNTE